MAIKTISFCPALIIDRNEQPKNISRKAWKFGAWADQYASLSNQEIHIKNGRTKILPLDGYAKKTALKIVSFILTLFILPMVALIAKALYKNFCSKHIKLIEDKPIIKSLIYTMPDLLAATEKFIQKTKVQNKVRAAIQLPDLKERILLTDRELIDHWFNHYNGFCIGEVHTTKGAKEFLVDNMAYLKQKGVKVLFMEHFCHETQKDLDVYLAGGALSAALQDRVNAIDLKNNFIAPYGYRGVLEAAKKEGIRIVAIDTQAAHYPKLSDESKRLMTMNYFAYKVMKPLINKPDFNYVALMGCGHLNKRGPIPGITTLLDCPNMIIDDKQKDDPFPIQLNATPYVQDIQTDLYYLR